MRNAASLLVAFLVWGIIFFGEIVYSVSWIWVMLTMYFIGYPFSAWVAMKVTGINPYSKM